MKCGRVNRRACLPPADGAEMGLVSTLSADGVETRPVSALSADGAEMVLFLLSAKCRNFCNSQILPHLKSAIDVYKKKLKFYRTFEMR